MNPTSLPPPSSAPTALEDETYVALASAEAIFASVSERRYTWIAAPAGFGKTTLLQALRKKLGADQLVLFVPLKASESLRKTPEEWNLTVADRILHILDIDTEKLATADGSAVFRRAVNEILKAHPNKEVVLLFDDIEYAPSDFWDDLRALWVERPLRETAMYARLTVAATAASVPTELPRGTSAHVGDQQERFEHWKVFSLEPFSRGALRDLANRSPSAKNVGDDELDIVFSWSLGHPELSARLLEVVAKKRGAADEFNVEALLDTHVRRTFAGKKPSDDRPSCLKRIRKDLDAFWETSEGTQSLRTHLRAIVFGKRLPEKPNAELLTALRTGGAIQWRGDKSMRAWPTNRAFEAFLADEWRRVSLEDEPPFKDELEQSKKRAKDSQEEPSLSRDTEAAARDWLEAHDRPDGAFKFLYDAGEATRERLRRRGSQWALASTGLLILTTVVAVFLVIALVKANNKEAEANVKKAAADGNRKAAEEALNAVLSQQAQRKEALAAEVKAALEEADRKDAVAQALEKRAQDSQTQAAREQAADARKVADAARKRATDAEQARRDAEAAAKAAEKARDDAMKKGSEDAAAREVMKLALTKCQDSLDNSRRATSDVEQKLVQCANERDRFKTTADSCTATAVTKLGGDAGVPPGAHGHTPAGG